MKVGLETFVWANSFAKFNVSSKGDLAIRRSGFAQIEKQVCNMLPADAIH
ncbi:MAG: hypothetical protein ACTS43_01780 [Candidatus Hodgkinia cicadicola]